MEDDVRFGRDGGAERVSIRERLKLVATKISFDDAGIPHVGAMRRRRAHTREHKIRMRSEMLEYARIRAEKARLGPGV
jgi:hypothetical protein